MAGAFRLTHYPLTVKFAPWINVADRYFDVETRRASLHSIC